MGFTSAEISAAREKRRAALLERWAGGSRLAAGELAEIADDISAGEKAGAEKDDAESFRLVAALPAKPTRSGYLHSLVDGCPYEKTYGATTRTLKLWRAAGRKIEPPEMPPLDEPWRMAAWYRRAMQRRVPPRLVELEDSGDPAARSPAQVGESSPASPAAVGATVEQAGALPDSAPEMAVVTGYAATLARFQRAEAVAHQRYIDAALAADPAVRERSAALQREWESIGDKLRAYERDAAKILRECGALWESATVVAALSDIHALIAAGVRRLHRRVRQRHPDLFALPASRQDALWDEAVDELFSALSNSGFTRDTAPPDSDSVADAGASSDDRRAA